jgi:hypothetical protein
MLGEGERSSTQELSWLRAIDYLVLRNGAARAGYAIMFGCVCQYYGPNIIDKSTNSSS